MLPLPTQVWDLSEQQLVDCVGPNDNCKGGWPDHAFQYIFRWPHPCGGSYSAAAWPQVLLVLFLLLQMCRQGLPSFSNSPMPISAPQPTNHPTPPHPTPPFRCSNGSVSEDNYPYQNGDAICNLQRIADAGSQNTAFMGSQAPGYAWLPSLSAADLLEVRRRDVVCDNVSQSWKGGCWK